MTVDGRSRPRSRWSRPSSTSRHNGDRPAAGLTNRTASDPSQLCPALADAPTTALARISSTTRSSSWYGSPTATTSVIAPSRAPASSAARGHRPGGGRGRSHRQRGAGRPATAVGGDHRECRFVRLEDQPDTADLGGDPGRCLAGARARLRAAGPAERARRRGRGRVLHRRGPRENRSMLTLLATLGRVETESAGPWSPPASRSPNRPERPGSHRAVAGERRVGSWSENGTFGGQAAAAGGAERRRLLGRGGLAGCGDWQGAGVDGVGVNGFEGDFVAVAFDGSDVAVDLAADVRALLVVVSAEVGVDGVGVR